MRTHTIIKMTALAAVGLLPTPLAGAIPAQAAVPAPRVINSSFTSQSAGNPTCWSLTRGPGILTVTTGAHSGTSAAQVRGAGAASLEVATTRDLQCGIPVAAGHRYAVGAWYHATTTVRPVVYTYGSAAGWRLWFTGTPFSPSTPWRNSVVTTPAVPAGTTMVSVGLTTAANGQLFLDDVAVTDIAMPEVTTAAAGAVLFRPAFSPTSALVTNEYAYWNPTHTNAVRSADWEMTSGSLFSANGDGYSGTIDTGKPDVLSKLHTNSSVFRLGTRINTYANVSVGFALNIQRLASTAKTPAVAWDGVDIWLRYQSQYNLYYASIARRDGSIVIKKKCPGGPSNDGTYYELSKEIQGYPVPLGQWMNVSASVRTNPGGTVTIIAYRNGVPVISGTDTGVGCPAITRQGSVGIRGDNAQFKFNTFTVATL
jgi:hypothetical protein